MNENLTNDRTASENLASSQMRGSPVREASHGVTGPHFGSHSPRVLARVPDLESAEPEIVEAKPPADRVGRMLSSGLSVWILAGGGALLLVAALALPLFFGNSDSSEPASQDERPAWQPEHPAPLAPTAPAWHGPSSGASNWQLPPSADGIRAPDMPATSAWNEDSQRYGWGEPSQGQPWDPASAPQTWGERSDTQGRSEQPPAQAWNGQPETMPSGAQPQWQAPGVQTDTPNWSGQVDLAPGRSPQDQAGWNTQPNATPGTYQRPTVSWNEEAQTPSWQVPSYRTAGQAQPRVAAPASSDSYQPPQGWSQQAQAVTNRSMTIGDYSPTGTSAYRTDWQQNEETRYRAADARADSLLGNRPDSQAAYPDTSQDAGYPPTSYPPSSYPPTSYPPSRYPTTGYPEESHLPSYPTTGYPQTGRPASSYPEPGVARFQGGIEKPTGSYVHDLDRSSIY